MAITSDDDDDESRQCLLAHEDDTTNQQLDVPDDVSINSDRCSSTVNHRLQVPGDRLSPVSLLIPHNVDEDSDSDFPTFEDDEDEDNDDDSNFNEENSDQGEDHTVPWTLWSSTRREKLVLVSLAVVDLTSMMCLSLMAPFMPKEATSKGVSDSTTGMIFGVFALAQFLFSPICGKLIPHTGPRFMLLTGQFFAGGCLILFGFLDSINTDDGTDTSLFVTYCLVLRVAMALGCACTNTASFALTAATFSDNPGVVFGLLETNIGLGMMLGPAVGGPLYELGGFRLPFLVMGSLMVAIVPLCFWTLPTHTEVVRLTPDGTGRSGALALLRVPAIIVVCAGIVVAAYVWAALDPILQPHLSVFDLSPSVLGLIFLLMSACYAIFSPIWGWVADHVEDSSPMLILGFLASTLGLLLLGPCPLFGLGEEYNELWLNLVALVILGISSSLTLVPTFDKILDAAEKAGIEDNFQMYSMVAGIWGSCYSLGEFLGPTVSGTVQQHVGFQWTMTCTAGLTAAMVLVVSGLWLFEKRYGTKSLCCSNCCNKKSIIPIIDAEDNFRDSVRTPLLGNRHQGRASYTGGMPRSYMGTSLRSDTASITSRSIGDHESRSRSRSRSTARRVKTPPPRYRKRAKSLESPTQQQQQGTSVKVVCRQNSSSVTANRTSYEQVQC